MNRPAPTPTPQRPREWLETESRKRAMSNTLHRADAKRAWQRFDEKAVVSAFGSFR